MSKKTKEVRKAAKKAKKTAKKARKNDDKVDTSRCSQSLRFQRRLTGTTRPPAERKNAPAACRALGGKARTCFSRRTSGVRRTFVRDWRMIATIRA